MDKIKLINGYKIERLGGFVCVKHWNIYKDGKYIGCTFKFRDAKNACMSDNFEKIYHGSMY